MLGENRSVAVAKRGFSTMQNGKRQTKRQFYLLAVPNLMPQSRTALGLQTKVSKSAV